MIHILQTDSESFQLVYNHLCREKEHRSGIARFDIGVGLHCVVVHGFGECSDVWRPFISDFSKEFRIVAPDLRGHGDSDWNSDGQYSFEGFLEDLEGILAELGEGRKILIGHSMGGQLIAEIAIRQKRAVAGVVLIDVGFGEAPEGDETIRRIQADYDTMMTAHPSIQAYTERLKSQRPLIQEDVAVDIAKFLLRRDKHGQYLPKSDPRLKVKNCRAHFNISRLAQIEAPVLIVRGVWSAVLPRQRAENIAEMLFDCELLNVAGAGHAVPTDNPQQLNNEIGPFMMKLARIYQ